MTPLTKIVLATSLTVFYAWAYRMGPSWRASYDRKRAEGASRSVREAVPTSSM
jgi:hypothetical protein